MEKTQKRKLTKAEQEAYSIVGRIRGQRSFEKAGKEGMSRIGKLGAAARWKNHKKKKHANKPQ